MKKRALLKVLAAPEDLEKLRGIFVQLRSSGVVISEETGKLGKKDMVLAVLSDRFYRNGELKAQLFDQLAAGAELLLPLNLEDAPIPDEIMNLLLARNIIMSAGRTDELLAQQILSAIPEKKNPLPKLLAAAVAVLVLLGGLFLWRALRPAETDPAVEAPIPNPLGITEEELAQINDVVIIGDTFAYFTASDHSRIWHWPDVYDYAYEVAEEDGIHWYSTEDGQPLTMTRYDDLRFLELMPNLNMLHMALVEADPEMLPDLRGAEHLNQVTIRNCSIGDISWISESSVMNLEVRGTDIEDYTSLSDCSRLKSITIDGQGEPAANLGDFAPPAVTELFLQGMQGEAELSALSACRNVTYLRLDDMQIQNLDFLADLSSLETLELNNLPWLQDISAVSRLENLKSLSLWYCDQVRDYTPVGTCYDLESLTIDRWNWIPADSSFLNSLSGLTNISLFGLNLNNMDFLGNLQKKQDLSLGFCGNIQDYSGLSHIKSFQQLHINPRSTGGRFGDFSLVAPYIQDAYVVDLDLQNCTNVDLAALPTMGNRLCINSSTLEDLSGLNGEFLQHLELRDLQYLRSLKGIESISRLHTNGLSLSIYSCIRLTDYSPLYGNTLYMLNLGGMYSLPDFGSFAVRFLRLESIADMEDLSCLESLDKTQAYNFEFPGMDDLKDLSALGDLRGGSLSVPPQVADQAAELVAGGNFREYTVCYPNSGWSPLNEEVILLSMEELETLPKAVLRRVSSVWIAGNEIMDPDRYELDEQWQQGHPVQLLRDRETGKTTPVQPGSITDFSLLSSLPNLRELQLAVQPISSLEGIQQLAGLIRFEATGCPNLQDVSALYAMQNLEDISLNSCPVDSIQGVQNLPRLRYLHIGNTQVTDLSPLTECDFSASDGIGLTIHGTKVEDLSPLAGIPAFSHLNVCGYPPERWMPHVENTFLRSFCGPMGSDETLRQFVQQHPELEEIHIESGYELTDLTPLLELDHLSYVHIWDGAETAVRSLDGCEIHFRLDVE